MKLKYVLSSLLIILIILISMDTYLQKGVLNKRYELEELRINQKSNKAGDTRKENTISSILKSILSYEDIEINSIQAKDNENINIQIICNDVDNLKSKAQSIEKISGFKSIDKVQIMSLENKKYVAVLDISFVK